MNRPPVYSQPAGQEPPEGTLAIVAGTEKLLLLPQKAIFWPAQATLLVADVHLGKAGHFRKAGIPISGRVHRQDLAVLSQLAQQYRAKRLLVLGDLFHAQHNAEWETFAQWCNDQAPLKVELVLGNHDILPAALWQASQIRCHRAPYAEGGLQFTHYPAESPADILEGRFNLCGHLHPQAILRGRGGQRLRLPCFYWQQRQGILPAFGEFTGGATIRPKAGETAYPIAEGRVLAFTASGHLTA